MDLEVALLLRLLHKGECKDARKHAELIGRFRTARWIEPSTRLNTWTVRPEARLALTKRLSTLRPDWEKDTALLRDAGLDPLDSESFAALAALRAGAHKPVGYLHRKTWNAHSAAGSKRLSKVPAKAQLTDDWSLRGRVNCATVFVGADGEVDLRAMTQTLTEFAIPQRALMRAVGFAGTLPEYVLTVENIGALVDLELPTATMVLYSQGLAYRAAMAVLDALPQATWVHFGDLDPAGLSIARRMARLTRRRLHLYVPAFASEYLDRKLPVIKSRWRPQADIPPVVQALVTSNAWLEQEVFLLDERLAKDLQAALQAASDAEAATQTK